jgi:hypothetical protein
MLVTIEGNKHILHGQILPIILSIDGSESIQIQGIKGQTQPISGWQSPSYGHKEPINTITATTQGKLPQTLITRISLGNDAATADISISEEITSMRWIMR